MAFAIERTTWMSEPYRMGEAQVLYVPDGYRKLIAIFNGFTVLDGRGRKIKTLRAKSHPLVLSSEIIIYPLAEDEDSPEKEFLSELD